MKLTSIVLTFTFLIFIGCKKSETTKENSKTSKIVLDNSAVISQDLSEWGRAINAKNIDSLAGFYDLDAIKIISADSIINGASEIAKNYINSTGEITSVESIFSVEANNKKAITYELLKYNIDNSQEYIQLLIWRNKNEKEIIDFEFTAKSGLAEANIETASINERRELWMKLCNENNAENLVNQLYSVNTLYFNHKPIVKGKKDLIKEYDYMNNEKYSLHLEPLKLEFVNADLAVEIGQCSRSYKGKYILVWKRQKDGIWNIYIDSNI